jgi:hypothetical protein
MFISSALTTVTTRSSSDGIVIAATFLQELVHLLWIKSENYEDSTVVVLLNPLFELRTNISSLLPSTSASQVCTHILDYTSIRSEVVILGL